MKMRTDNSAFKIINFAGSAFEFDHLAFLFESNSMCYNLRFEIFYLDYFLVSQPKSLKAARVRKKKATNFTSSN